MGSIRFWLSVIAEAHSITFRVLFGSVRRLIIEGLFFGIAVALLYRAGEASLILEQLTWVQATLLAALIVYASVMTANIFRVPALWQNEALTEIKKFRKLAGEIDTSPSFAITIEMTEPDKELDENIGRKLNHSDSMSLIFKNKSVCRICVENLTDKHIMDCRLVIEEVKPENIVSRGALLLPDMRGSDDLPSALFNLARLEKKYFKFLEFDTGPNGELGVRICSDNDGIGVVGMVVRSKLVPFNADVYIGLAVHGEGANSNRASLKLRVGDNGITIAESQTNQIPQPQERSLSGVAQ